MDENGSGSFETLTLPVQKIDVLDKGYVRYDKHMGSDLDVVNSAKVSFDRRSETFEAKEARLLGFLVREEHTSVFRHSAITFEVYAPLIIARQWWKYAVASSHVEDQLGWNESSRRYITENVEFYVPDAWRTAPENRKQGSGADMPFLPPDMTYGDRNYWDVTAELEWRNARNHFWEEYKANPTRALLTMRREERYKGYGYLPSIADSAMTRYLEKGPIELAPKDYGAWWTARLEKMHRESSYVYENAMKWGIAPEQARLFLPAYGLYVRWRWTASLGAVLHFLHQRLAHDAQSELRDYAKAVKTILADKFPQAVAATLETI